MALCAALAGCGSQNTAARPSAAPPQPPQYTCAAGDGFTGDFFDIAFQKPVVIAGRVWLADYLTLYSCGLDGRDQTDWQAPNYSEQIVQQLPTDWTGDWKLCGPYPAADGGLALLDRRFFRFADAAKDCGWLFYYRFDAAGQLQESRQLSLPPQFPSFLGTDTSLLLDQTLYWLDGVSRQLCSLSLDDGGFSAHPLPQGLDCDQLYLLPDGGLLTVGRQQMPGDWQRHPAWCRFETDTARFGEVVALPENTLSGGAVTVFAADADSWLLWDADGIYRYRPAAQTVQAVCRWLACGVVPGDLLSVAALEQGRFLALCLTDGQLQPLTLAPVDPDVQQTVTTVTLGILSPLQQNLPGLARAVSDFNRAQAGIQVQVVDYTLDGAENDGPWQRLDRDIVNGTLPDILLGDVDDSWLAKGVFQDLYPLLDADPELDRQDFLAGPLRAGERDGQLLRLMPGYYLDILVGPTALLGTQSGWTFEAFFALLESQPQAVRAIATANDAVFLLCTLVRNGYERFVDAKTHSCDFLDDTFLRLLEFCGRYSAADAPQDATAIDLRQAFGEQTALAFEDSLLFDQPFDRLRGYTYSCQGDFTIKGYPCAAGDSGGIVGANQVLLLSSQCADTAAAWQFIRTLLLPQGQYNICHTGYAEGEGYALLPLRRDTLEALAQQAMQPRATAAGLPSYLYQDAAAWQDPYWCRAITRQEADRLIAALESATASTAQPQVVSIVAEEAAVYFAGDCSAQQAAARIQDRVSTYLAEDA